MNASWHTTNDSHHMYKWFVSHVSKPSTVPNIRMSQITHTNESCHTCQWVMSHMCMGHVTYLSGSCPTYEWVMSQIWTSLVSHIKISHVTHVKVLCPHSSVAVCCSVLQYFAVCVAMYCSAFRCAVLLKWLARSHFSSRTHAPPTHTLTPT